jgi:hypothetical protein
MTSTTVRTYRIGDEGALDDYAGGTYQPGVCNLRLADQPGHTGYGMCSMPDGHDGSQHVAMTTPDRTVVGIAPREVPDDATGDAERLREAAAEIGRLQEQLITARNDADQLRSIRDNLIRENERKDEAHQEFRQRVGRVAMRYARRHDWCSVVRQALNELGIEVTQRWRVRTDVYASYGEWEAKRESVYVTVESNEEQGYVYRTVDGLDADDAINALELAGVDLPDGFEFSRFDASTSDVTPVDDED